MARTAAKRTAKASDAPLVVAAPPKRVRVSAPRKRAQDPAQPAPPEAHDDGLAHTLEQRRALPGFGRDNPNALAGDALRELAHERGMARSELSTMTDDKVREQLRYLVSAAYSEA